MSRDAPPGAVSRKSTALTLPWPVRTTANPPPPMLPAVGSVTASANAVATAAAKALPADASTSVPAFVAYASSDATMYVLPVPASAGSTPNVDAGVRYGGGGGPASTGATAGSAGGGATT